MKTNYIAIEQNITTTMEPNSELINRTIEISKNTNKPKRKYTKRNKLQKDDIEVINQVEDKKEINNENNGYIEYYENETGENITQDNYIEPPWTIIESYFKNQHLTRLVRHQLESYNNFINFQIRRTIDMFNPLRVVSEHDFDPVSKNMHLRFILHLRISVFIDRKYKKIMVQLS